MKRILVFVLVILCACSNSTFTKKEKAKLEEFDISEYSLKDCKYIDSLKTMLESEFNPGYIEQYCSIADIDAKTVNIMIDRGVSVEDIDTYHSIPFFKIENLDRYIAYQAESIDEKVKMVNLDMDLSPYEHIDIVDDADSDVMLVNKFYALPDGYEPKNLVDVKSKCTIGLDYSCTTMEKVQLRKTAADAFEQFVQEAKSQGIDIVAIACYRDYAYQKGLYDYNKNLYGEAYADTYYARPGQSEHNSGLAVDITFNGYRYDEIENYDGYDWILSHMHDYGFVLRYPKDKQEITRYGYESWHMRYVGKEAALTMYENNYTLEEYHAYKK